jgi:hypothetical protein
MMQSPKQCNPRRQNVDASFRAVIDNQVSVLTCQCDLADEPSERMGADMRLAEWQKGAVVASIACAISGFYCGMYLPVAPALRAYEHCTASVRPAADCKSEFLSEWKIHSPYRIESGLAWALIPIPLIGLIFYAARRRSNFSLWPMRWPSVDRGDDFRVSAAER